MSSSASEIKCSICDTKFTQKKNLYAHLRNIHGSDSLGINNYVCKVCEKTFKVQKTLDTHIKKYHKNGDANRETRIICPYNECNEPLLQKFGHDKICVDGTHGTNAYDIQLYTVVTVDEFGSGCPVAFCLSNRSDER